MTIPIDLQDILCSDPHVLGGSVRFRGTRVPVQALLDTILAGESVDYFLDDFPDVTRDQAFAVLRYEQNAVRTLFGLDLAS